MSRNTLTDISNSVFGLSISKKLSDLRDEYCPYVGRFNCGIDCGIWRKYYGLGYSCNEALYTFPEECQSIMQKKGSIKNIDQNRKDD